MAAAAALSAGKHRQGYGAVKQVTKTNFSSELQQIRAHINQSDFIAVSSQKTGDFSSSSTWRRILPIDTPEIAYLKSKAAADTFQLLQFAVCPFSIRGSKVLAFPYNFHLFPRDELNLAMPSYSFSCQMSFLASMAREGFDFNACIYDGISYLSRVQESKAKERNRVPQVRHVASFSNPSVANSLFMGRIKSRVEHWRNACKNKDNTADGSLVNSLRKLILGDELYGSRPCISIDVCSDHQVQLVLEIVNKIGDDLVPLVVPERGGTKAVRVVLTSSEEDKNLLMSEIENLEEEQNLKVRGFREVIDLISSSQKPIVTYNCLHDFTFIHSQFLAPLPPSLSEFMCSLRLVFPNILDVNHLSKEVGPWRKAKTIEATLSYLKRQFFVPIELETPQQADDGKTEKNHGHNILRITSLFVKLCNLLKITSDCQNTNRVMHKSVDDYANIFYPTCTSLQEPGDDEEVNLLPDNNRRKVSTDNVVFLWGFGDRVTASELKPRLQRTHPMFSEDFELQLVDKTCSVIVFWKTAAAQALVKAMESGEGGSSALREMISDGLKGAGYETYKKVCRLDFWKGNMADSLEAALAEPEPESECRLSTSSGKDASEIYWNTELMIDLNNL